MKPGGRSLLGRVMVIRCPSPDIESGRLDYRPRLAVGAISVMGCKRGVALTLSRVRRMGL